VTDATAHIVKVSAMPNEPVAASVALLTATGIRLVAQTGALDPTLGTLIGNLGIMGVLVWHLWYHTTHSYPQMLSKFTEEVDKLRDAFQREQEAQRSFASRETAELRNMLIQNLQAMRVAVHDVKDTAQSVMSQSALTRAQAAAEETKGQKS
jgi:hypothetical protein